MLSLSLSICLFISVCLFQTLSLFLLLFPGFEERVTFQFFFCFKLQNFYHVQFFATGLKNVPVFKPSFDASYQ